MVSVLRRFAASVLPQHHLCLIDGNCINKKHQIKKRKRNAWTLPGRTTKVRAKGLTHCDKLGGKVLQVI